MPSSILRNWVVYLTMLPLSAGVWLLVTSSWAIILHAVAKLGVATPKYGTVNLVLLIAALVWSFAGWIVLRNVVVLPRGAISLAYFVVGILIIFLTISAIAFYFDELLSQYALPAVLLELLELCLAIWISWIVFGNDSSSGLTFLRSSLVGMLGLIVVTTLVLLIFPRVTFRI